MSPKKSVILHSHLQPDLYQEYIVASPHMRQIMETVNRVSRFDANVLISGESGTGKELLARIIHQLSPRRDRPFVPMNCGTLSGDLFESKLFGHEAGAFTGAHKRIKGRFELAHQGTLFLDEVSEISPQNQVNFLRVLEDGWFSRIGGEKPIRVNVRIVAATNKDLAAETKAGRFRHDLYYRLQVIPIELLPLRERREAIPFFVQHFLDRFAVLHQKEKISFTPEAMACLQAAQWPGNIRQLKNFLERLFLMTDKRCLDVADLPPDFFQMCPNHAPPRTALLVDPGAVTPTSDHPIEPLWRARRRLEMDLILKALEVTGGRREQAARLLEIKPRTLRQKMQTYGITFRRNRSRPPEETRP